VSQETKDQILDTAERLFADRGIEAVSLRTLTSEAGVNLASVHYHFGSKETLVTEVFDRRVDRMNYERLAMLEEVERQAGDGPLPLEDVLRAFFAPAIRTSQTGSTFMRLCGRMYAEPAEYVQKYFDEKFGPMIERFAAAFARAVPGLSLKERGWRMHFAAPPARWFSRCWRAKSSSTTREDCATRPTSTKRSSRWCISRPPECGRRPC
jgi:AcrR family transcriptional regulator